MRTGLSILEGIRSSFAMVGLLVCSCAAGGVTRSEHVDAMSSIRALQAENARFERRLEKLEAQAAVPHGAQAPKATEPAPVINAPASWSSADAVPPLAVVKLKPKREPAPRLATHVEVAEPNPSVHFDAVQDEEAAAADFSVAETQFEAALSLMKTGNSEQGVASMLQFTIDWAHHPKADNALYYSGLAYLSQKDFPRAAELFERVLSNYPAGDARVEAMLKLGDCRLRLQQPREARATWQEIVTHFPGTSAAAQAQTRLASTQSIASP
jgi:tol-pal system protein YbgF